MQDIVYNNKNKTIIDIDLLLDYTKIVYAELLDARSVMVSNNASLLENELQNNMPVTPKSEVNEVKQEVVNEKIIEKEPTIETKPEPVLEKTSLVDESNVVEINFEKPTNENATFSTPVENSKKEDTTVAELPNINKIISLNDKFAYVIELFNGDNQLYENSIEDLNNLKSYNESLNWIISNLQNKYNWNVESDIVISFYDSINRRFSKK